MSCPTTTETAEALLIAAARDSFDSLGISGAFLSISDVRAIDAELTRTAYDFVFWRICSVDDLSSLKRFLQSTPNHPAVVAIASHNHPDLLQVPLAGLLGRGLRDFCFDNEPAVLARIARRIVAEQTPALTVDVDPALGEAPQALAAFLHVCPLPVVALTLDGNVLIWNPAAEQTFGWSAAEVIGKPLPTIPIGSEPEFRQLLESQMLGISQDGREVLRQCKDGSLIHVSLWTAPLRDKSRRVRAKFALFADMTAQQQAERERAQLRESERAAREQIRTMDRFRELLEAAPDAIIEVDAAGRIVLFNAITERIFGYTREELTGMSVDCLIPDAQRGRHAAHRERYAAQPHTRPMGTGLQLFAQRKDGTKFAVEVSLSPVKSTSDSTYQTDGVRVSAIVRDTSDRARTEELLREVRDKFTAELSAANRELEIRNREIERANRLKSEFLASMSHELRTPLHTIVGISELLAEELEGPLNPKQKRFVSHIQKDSLHLLDLINDILDISKIEAGKLQLHAETFDAIEALNEVLTSIGPLATVKLISIERPACPHFNVHADRLRFKQIFYNFLSNAVKFTPAEGHVAITCEPGDGQVTFSVSDTGIGIPGDELAAIFEKFHQVGSTTKGVREGTGLGLAITKHIIEQHGGRIWVESSPGSGSRFFFTLPA